MGLQITNDDWLQQVDTVISGTEPSYLLGQFNSPFVIVAIASASANPLWDKAGSVSQAIDTTIGKVYGTKQELFLGNPNLIKSDALNSQSYELWYFPLDRLAETSIKVWEYQGETVDSQIQVLVDSLKQSDFLSEDLSGIGAKIDSLLSGQAEIGTSCTTNTSEIKSILATILDLLDSSEPPEPPELESFNYLELRVLQLI